MHTAAPLPTIAFLGLGTMGEPMAGRLLTAGYPLRVWNRTGSKAGLLVRSGAYRAPYPADAVAKAQIVITMLADPEAATAVVQGSRGVVETLPEGALLVDMSTVDPATSKRLAAVAAERGARFVDAPVYGSKKPAEEGQLVVLAGGDEADIEALLPIFKVLARRVFHAGAVGAGSALKLAINLVGAHVMTGLATGLNFAEREGISGGLFLEALGEGAFTSPLAAIKGPKMLQGDFSPAFSVDLIAKDLRLVLATARESGTAVPSVEALWQLFLEGASRGHGREDLSAVYEVLVELSTRR